MKPIFFNPDVKLADILHNNYQFLQMLDRFGIKFGFGDQTVGEVCNKHNINIHLFVLVANTVNHPAYIPEKSDIASCPPDELLRFLQKSHEYYINYRFPELERQLKELTSTWDDVPAKMVESFFTEYKKEVHEHLGYEDEVVFPYIEKLINHTDTEGYTILEFEKKHDDIESKVKDLKNILIKYIPERNDAMKRNEFLLHLFLLEEDLNKHLLIENEVLIPAAILLEENR